MEGGAYIGVGVMAVEGTHQFGQNIVPGKGRGTQELYGWIAVEKQQADGIGKDDKPHQPFKHRSVGEKSIEMDAYQINEPEQIWDQEDFAKRDHIIQRAVHYMIAAGAEEVFRGIEQYPIHGPVQRQKQALPGIGVKGKGNTPH